VCYEKSLAKRFSEEYSNVIVVNNGHRVFVYVARTKTLKLRYLIHLYAKELVLKKFVGLAPDQLLASMVELSLRNENLYFTRVALNIRKSCE